MLQQGIEYRGAVETRYAHPHDVAHLVDQGADAAIADESEIEVALLFDATSCHYSNVDQVDGAMREHRRDSRGDVVRRSYLRRL